MIKSLKPFKHGDPALYAVHTLDIQDKHTGIIPAVGYVQRPPIGVGAAFVGQTPRIVSSGQALMLGGIEGRIGTFPLPVRLVFHPSSDFADQEIAPTLHSLTLSFTKIIDKFEPLCAGPKE